ncbi:MAG: Hpt domain-containing protein [Phaeodactylibacter sp.]|nr:Hpt domain-containing protein [Phaeodactylibacter sp.]
MQHRYIQLDYLEKMAGGDPKTRREMLQMLAEELEKSGARLKTLREEQNQQELQWLCHHLKSTLSFVGNEQLAKTNKGLEQLLQQKTDFEPLIPLLFQIENLITKALQELLRELKRN